jgi:hypothetical protein
VHRRHVESPITEHRRLSAGSIVHPDPLKAVLPTDKVTLKRHLGLFSGVCFIIGTIIGESLHIVCLFLITIICSYQVRVYLFHPKVSYEKHNLSVCVWSFGLHVDLSLCLVDFTKIFVQKIQFRMFSRCTLLCRDWYSNTKKWCRNRLYERR